MENSSSVGAFTHENNDQEDQIQNKEETPVPLKKPKGWGTRHTFIFMAFMARVIEQGLRVNLSLAIVAMVKQGESGAKIGTECPFPEEPESSLSSSNDTVIQESTGEFDWNAQEQGIILGAFYYGFIFTMLPGGYLSERYSGKWVLFVSFAGATLCNFLAPWTARQGGYVGFIILKVVQGFVQGPVIPGAMALISDWIPPAERSTSMTYIWGGQQLGTVLTFFLCGIIAEQFGWEWDFYLFAIFGAVFCVAWIFMVYSSPKDHPRISEDEKAYIETAIQEHKSKLTKLPVPPFKQIFTSVPFWALVFTFVCSAWGFYTLLTEIPTYLNNIQHIPLGANGIVSALPYLLSWAWSLPIGWLTDWIIGKGKMSRGRIRKLNSAIGLLAPAVMLLILTAIGCNPTLAITLLCLAVMLQGTALSGYNVNQLELSPNYAGTLRGGSSTLANICGFATPALVGTITQGEQTIASWNKVFYVAAGMYAVGTVIFLTFGRTSVQKWNNYWEHEDSHLEPEVVDENQPLLSKTRKPSK